MSIQLIIIFGHNYIFSIIFIVETTTYYEEPFIKCPNLKA